MANTVVGRKERRRKWWAKILNTKTRASNTGDSGSKEETERGKSLNLDGAVLEQTHFEETQTQLSCPVGANTAGFRSSSHAERLSNPNKKQPPPPTETLTLPSTTERTDTSDTNSGSDSGSETAGGQPTGPSGRRRRYIAFVGNLPFSATAGEVMEHFARRGVRVVETRMLTRRNSGESRGCCFAEFPDTKSLQNALKFHHTLMHGRRLNVEVTCGGGGKGDRRMKKIKQRNHRLRKARKKRVKSQKGQEQKG